VPAPARRDEDLRPAVAEYISRSAALMDRLDEGLAGLAERGAPIVVWGVGQLTFKLLAMTRLAGIPIRAFLDTNPAYHGMTLRGAPILPPEVVVRYTDPVLIGTMLHAGAIETRLRELGAANPVLRLAA
jgi:hypothetical protein